MLNIQSLSQFNQDKKNILFAIVLLVLCVVSYSNSLENGFLIDDYSEIINDSVMHHPKNFGLVFLHSDFLESETLLHYRPVTRVFRLFKYHFFGHTPYLYRLSNLFLLYFCCIFIFILLKELTGDYKIAFLTALLFCIHPINTTHVNMITLDEDIVYGTSAILSLISLLLALDSKVKLKRTAYYLVSHMLFLGALLSHEIIFMFPFYIILTLFVIKKYSLKRSIVTSISYFSILVIYVIFRFFFASIKSGVLDKVMEQRIGLWQYLATMTDLYFWYISKFFAPYGIVFMWNVDPAEHHVVFKSFVFIAVITAILILILKYWKKDFKTFALLWFVLGFVPAAFLSFFYQTQGFTIEPHWFFFSSIGFFMLTAVFLKFINERFGQNTFIFLVCGLCLFFIVRVRAMNPLWTSQKTYSQYWLKLRPNVHPPKFFLAHAYFLEGNFAKARYYFKGAIIDDFLDWQVYSNLGLMDLREGNLKSAVKHFHKALEIYPAAAVVHNNLGLLYKEDSKTSKAKEHFLKASMIDPYLLEPRLNLVPIYREEGQTNKAIELCKQNLNIDSYHADSLYVLTELYFETGKKEKAKKTATTLLRTSNNSELLTKAGSLSAQNNLHDTAVHLFETALRYDPKNEQAFLETGKLLGNLGQYDEAISVWQIGQSINPANAQFDVLIKSAEKLKR